VASPQRADVVPSAMRLPLGPLLHFLGRSAVPPVLSPPLHTNGTVPIIPSVAIVAGLPGRPGRGCLQRRWTSSITSHGGGGGSSSNHSGLADTKVTPEEVSYSVVIELCARRGDVSGAATWLQEMAASPVGPNVFAFNSVIRGFAKKGSALKAAEWLDRMIAEGLEPNVVSYTAVIDSCVKVGDAEGAARWFDTMLGNGVLPNAFTYNAIINSCAALGDVDGALKWLERMRSAGPLVVLDEISYNSAIKSCANASPPRADKAEELFRTMREAGLYPTISTIRALERAVGDHRSRELCGDLRVDMRIALARGQRRRTSGGHRRPASFFSAAERPGDGG